MLNCAWFRSREVVTVAGPTGVEPPAAADRARVLNVLYPLACSAALRFAPPPGTRAHRCRVDADDHALVFELRKASRDQQGGGRGRDF